MPPSWTNWRMRAAVCGAGEIERRDDEHGVAGQVAVGRDEVDADPLVPQRAVVRVRPVEVGQVAGRVGVELRGPPALPVEDHGDVVAHDAAGHLADALQVRTQRADLAPYLRVGAGVREQRRVELLRARAGLPPLEEQHRVAAARDVAKLLRRSCPGQLGDVALLPVDGAGRVLHEQPRPAGGEAASEVGTERELHVVVGICSCRGSGRWRRRRHRPPRTSSPCCARTSWP